MYKEKLNFNIQTINFEKINLQRIVKLIINNQNIYIKLPIEVTIKTENKNIYIIGTNKLHLYKIITYIKYQVENFINIKTIYFKGLGFNAKFIRSKLYTSIEFKIGYSNVRHLLFLNNEINIKQKKKSKILSLNSIKLDKLGNYCNKIKNLRKTNTYTGKGFWLKSDSIKLKKFKKK